MRTNIDIDDALMKQAMRAAGATTKKATVEAALRQIVRLKKQEGIRKLFGKVEWDGDLAAMRTSRALEPEEEAAHTGQGKRSGKTAGAAGGTRQERPW